VLCKAAESQTIPLLAGDGAGGAIVTWSDRRNGVNQDIFAQRIDSTGAVRWATDGIAVASGDHIAWQPDISNAGSGQAIIAWEDFRSGTGTDIYVQRIDSSGTFGNQQNGIVVSSATRNQQLPKIAYGGSAGVFFAWTDTRNGDNSDIYADILKSVLLSVSEDKQPEQFNLLQNFPNPFNPETHIQFQLSQARHVVLTIFNIRGKVIRTLIDEQKPSGSFRVTWDGRDHSGNKVASGLYLYELTAGDFFQTNR
jgi:hypothetical protein